MQICIVVPSLVSLYNLPLHSEVLILKWLQSICFLKGNLYMYTYIYVYVRIYIYIYM